LIEWMGPNWIYSIEREKFVAKQGMRTRNMVLLPLVTSICAKSKV
jgi:hypothetical protein